MLVVSITEGIGVGLGIDRTFGVQIVHRVSRGDGIGRSDPVQFEELVLVELAEPAAREVNRRPRRFPRRNDEVTRMRLVAETAHRTDERREPCPPDTELLAVLDARNDRLIDARAVLEVALRPPESPSPRRNQPADHLVSKLLLWAPGARLRIPSHARNIARRTYLRVIRRCTDGCPRFEFDR